MSPAMYEIDVSKVQIMWEGHKIKKNIPSCFEIMYFVSPKQSEQFVQISMAFSKYLNFTAIC